MRLYPHSTSEGRAIPLDILGPSEFLTPIAITTAPLGATIPLPNYADRLLEIWSDVDCRIGFDTTPVNNAGHYLLQGSKTRILLPLAAQISAQSLTTSGTLYVNLIVRWEEMRQLHQTTVGE